ncbi:glycosyltransferase family 4 protein [Flagellimonas onchidii]|uniref:glycosyltransferase family 4 protein n=1 Tax=Flagellimonas onchidii TaxID=2562684 RepID=UPI0010A5CF1B|nr:glycosyltransferase family 4 protein [Allomuricauda onchidii]
MKIDFIIGSMIGGGAERVVSLLANYFAQNGHRVRVITFYGDDAYDFHPDIKRIRFHKKAIINYASFRGFFSLLSFYFRKKNRPDYVSTHIGMVGYATIIPTKLYGIKSVVSEHFNHLHQPSTLPIKFLWHVLFRLPNAITVLTKFDLPFFKKINQNTVIMENPCSFVINSNAPKTRERTIVAAGNLDRYVHKGFDNLLDIVHEVFKTHPDWNLKIVGGGEIGMPPLVEKAKKLGLENKVEFSGFRKDVKEIMAKSDIYILTSRYEGLPMVLIEAMSQGMACIAYDCVSGPSEIIDDGKNGILVSDQNKEEMIQKLGELIDNEKLRESLRANTVKSLDKFSLENVGKKWENLLSNL